MGAVSGRFALYATDTQGAMRAVELERHLDQVDLFVGADVRAALPDFVCSFQHSVQDVLNTHLDHYECHIVFLRPGQSGWQLVGGFPLNGNQHRVLVIAVDTSAGICLPVYGEHEAGRLHQLTEQVAWLLGLQPVLSFPGSQDETRQCLLSLGLRHGWTLEPASSAALQRVATALFQKRPVAWVQSSGARPIWPLGAAGSGVVQHCSLDTINPDAYDALVLVSDQLGISEKLALYSDKTLIWRPKSLVVGVYCHRDTPLEVVGQGLVQFLDDNGLSIDSVRYMAGLDLQRHHPALNDFGIIHDIPLLTYRIEELLGAAPERPVALMKRLWENGRFSVADAAARHCSGATTALVPESNFCLQTDGPSVSMVICRIPESHVATSLPEPGPTKRHRPEHGGRHQIVVCSGVHCSRAGSCHRLADYVRRLARDLRLDQGARQIQVASSVCCVACRYKNSAVIHERLSAHETPVNEGVRLRGVHSFSRSQWQQILRAVNRRQPLRSLVAPSHLVPMGNE
ncbi:cobalamin biosynthesis protein [Kistimonas asteriae]|uniref:cobalamin biosynthesis protein n=1 Tax=Kistimonas asteriae TaxID=517724 RepID=UPI001BAA6B52|nr:cobalamin biosynthesis protein [Kistimonas asteriae]